MSAVRTAANAEIADADQHQEGHDCQGWDPDDLPVFEGRVSGLVVAGGSGSAIIDIGKSVDQVTGVGAPPRTIQQILKIPQGVANVLVSWVESAPLLALLKLGCTIGTSVQSCINLRLLGIRVSWVINRRICHSTWAIPLAEIGSGQHADWVGPPDGIIIAGNTVTLKGTIGKNQSKHTQGQEHENEEHDHDLEEADQTATLLPDANDAEDGEDDDQGIGPEEAADNDVPGVSVGEEDLAVEAGPDGDSGHGQPHDQDHNGPEGRESFGAGEHIIYVDVRLALILATYNSAADPLYCI